MRISPEFLTNGWAMGCQAWTFNHYTVLEAIEKTALTGAKVIEFFPGQRLSGDDTSGFGHDSTDAQIARVQEKLKASGIKMVNYGVVGLGTDVKENRKVFDFAKKMGIDRVTSEPDVAGMDGIEKLVKEYDIRVGIHNHPRQPNNPKYQNWDPNYILSLVKDRDKRIGSCADTGHWVRSGIKPVDALRILRGRVLSSHLKDLNQFSPDAHDAPYGTGVSDVVGILAELKRQGFEGNISVEYEYNWEASVPDVAQCIGFVRAVGALTR